MQICVRVSSHAPYLAQLRFPDSPIQHTHPPNSSLGRAWKTTYLLPRSRMAMGLPVHPSVYKRTTNTLPWLSARMNIVSSPLYPQDPDQAPMRTSLPRTSAHPKSSSSLHHPLHALACMRPLLSSLASLSSFGPSPPCDPIRSIFPFWGPFVFLNRGTVAPRIAVKDASRLRFISDGVLSPSPRVMPHLVPDTVHVVSAMPPRARSSSSSCTSTTAPQSS